MLPVLFAWRGIVLHSFPVMIYAALLTALIVTVQLGQAAGLDPDRIAAAVLLSYVPAFACARALYVARHWDHFREDPIRMLRRSEGGLSLFGGMFGMFAGIAPLSWMFGLPLAPLFDALVPGVLAGLAVAKVACVLNGCCCGHESDHWCAAKLPDERGRWRRRLPAPFLEMGWALVVFTLAVAALQLSPRPGLVACGALALHTAGRMVLQGLRDEGAREDAAVRRNCLILMAAAGLTGLFILL